jgi:hypothetical protein
MQDDMSVLLDRDRVLMSSGLDSDSQIQTRLKATSKVSETVLRELSVARFEDREVRILKDQSKGIFKYLMVS